jgi:predicted transcriptional regulator
MATVSQFAHLSKNHDTIDDIKNINIISMQKDNSIYDAMSNLISNKISKILNFDGIKSPPPSHAIFPDPLWLQPSA